MLLGGIRQFNWLDIVVLILILRIGYIALKNGLPVELFKFFGTIFSVYLSMHYYVLWAVYLQERIPLKNISLGFLRLFSFVALSALGYFIFLLLRKVFYRLITVEPVEKLNKWGGFILSMLRGILLLSLILFILVISNISYLNKSARNSYLGRRIFKVAPFVYSGLWNNLVSKFRTAEEFNKAILEVQPLGSAVKPNP
ncbi:MAG: CvpA family protein [Candidatus Omnitrophica bacterium]|nr:CvpA family protein [Candidatus Omnitrophota bacterium]